MATYIHGERENKPKNKHWKLVRTDCGRVCLCTMDRDDSYVDLYVLEIRDDGLYPISDGNPWYSDDHDDEVSLKMMVVSCP